MNYKNYYRCPHGCFSKGLENALQENPDHPFVMIHMGQLKADDVGRLISMPQNIYILTSHSNPVVTSKSNQPWVNHF
jgi:predicted TIM-barrel fold metal-dependent hydrolase